MLVLRHGEALCDHYLMIALDSTLTNVSTGASHPLRTLALAIAMASAALVGVVGVDVDEASAAPAMETNAMTSAVTASARRALESYEQWADSYEVDALRSFVWFRTQTAQYAAVELGISEADMVEAWAATPIGHQVAVLAAMTQLGVPYRTNASEEGVGFDCSGLTTYAWAKAGVQLTRRSSDQIRNAAPVKRAEAKAGDLVQYPGHVMMYLGVGDAIVHSSRTGRPVQVGTVSARRANSVRFGDPTV